MPGSSFAIEATVGASPADSFSASAYILGSRWKHHRTRDHFGAESDLYVVLSQQIGKYPEGTPVHWVIADLFDRIDSLENSNRRRSSFSMDAWSALSGTYGRGIIPSFAVLFDTSATQTFTADADIIAGTFTVDARLSPTFTIYAFVI